MFTSINQEFCNTHAENTQPVKEQIDVEVSPHKQGKTLHGRFCHD